MIPDLNLSEQISPGAAAFCAENRLCTVHSVYTFLMLPSRREIIKEVGAPVVQELKNLALSHLKYAVMNCDKPDVPVEIFIESDNLARNAVNVSWFLGIKTLGSVIEVNIANSGFLKVKRGTEKVDRELSRICVKYIDYFFDDSEFEVSLNASAKLRKLREIAEGGKEVPSHFNILLKPLSEVPELDTRCITICEGAGLRTMKDILHQYITHPQSGFSWLRSCGAYTNKYLCSISRQYEALLTADEQAPDSVSEITPFGKLLENLRLVEQTLDLVKESISGFDRVPVFRFLDILINQNAIFKKRNETQIFKEHSLCYLPKRSSNMGKTAKLMGLTRERVRQIKQDALKRCRNCFQFINTRQVQPFFHDYLGSESVTIMIVSDNAAELINRNEGTNFSPAFMTYILSLMYKDSYSLIGNVSMIFDRGRTRKVKKHELYMVDSSLAALFDFNDFLAMMKEAASSKRKYLERNTIISLDQYFRTDTPSGYDKIREALQFILDRNFAGLAQVDEIEFHLRWTEKMTISGHVEELLRNSARPMHSTEIFARLLEKGVTVASVQSLLMCMNLDNRGFGIKGPGYYDLLSNGGLFGTVGDVAEQLLRKKKGPIHIRKLEKLICKELIVKKVSIPTILLNYSMEKRFMRDSEGNIGLKEW